MDEQNTVVEVAGINTHAPVDTTAKAYCENGEAVIPKPTAIVAQDNVAEIHQHLNDMEKAICDFGSAGGHVLTELINLVRSKL